MCNPADIGNFDLTVGAGSALFKPVPAFSLLLGSAGAVDALTRALAVDLAPLRVNVICPGAVETEVSQTL